MCGGGIPSALISQMPLKVIPGHCKLLRENLLVSRLGWGGLKAKWQKTHNPDMRLKINKYPYAQINCLTRMGSLEVIWFNTSGKLSYVSNSALVTWDKIKPGIPKSL